VPWRVIDMRNRVSHGYFDIDVVWNTRHATYRNSRNLSPGSLPRWDTSRVYDVATLGPPSRSGRARGCADPLLWSS